MNSTITTSISPELRSKHYVFLICAPENFVHSNGITVLLNAALSLRSLGMRVGVVPSTSTTPTYARLAEPYTALPILWEVPLGCSAILSDTVSKERLQEVRTRAAQICHYTMAPNGLFGAEGPWGNRILIQPGEKQAVYSPHISTQLPSFYLQTHFRDLEPWIEAASHYPSKASGNPSRHLKASVYPGKGHLKPAPNELRRRIIRSQSHLIGRFYPPTKSALYELLASSDLMICYDPITSLAFEANLLGIPVYIPLDWDEKAFKNSFPARLDGIVYNDLPEFMHILSHGFDQQSVVLSYRNALERNTSVILELLHFAFVDVSTTRSADQINSYWDSRQLFFASLKLPSLAGRETMKQALPARNASELLHDILERMGEQFGRFSRMVSIRRRGLERRLHSLLRAWTS